MKRPFSGAVTTKRHRITSEFTNSVKGENVGMPQKISGGGNHRSLKSTGFHIIRGGNGNV